MKKEPINLRLKRLRKGKGLSQEAAAEKLRMSRQTVNNWERHNTVPNYYDLLKIKELYEVSWDELMGGLDTDAILDLLRPLEDVWKSLEESGGPLLDENGNVCNLKALSKAGYYRITDDAFYKAFGYWNFDPPHLAEVAIRLKKLGSLITSISEKSIGVFFKTDDDAKNFIKDVDGVVDDLVHHWDDDFTDQEELGNRYYPGEWATIRYAYSRLFDIPENQTKYYCLLDEDGNERGFSMTKDGCEELAKIQKLEEYEIHLDDEDE